MHFELEIFPLKCSPEGFKWPDMYVQELVLFMLCPCIYKAAFCLKGSTSV